MKTSAFLLLFLLAVATIKSENTGITLTFTAKHNDAYIKMDSILIENLNRDAYKVLYYPDTVLNLVSTYIDIIDGAYNELFVSQNYPNPFSAKTHIDVYVPDRNRVSLDIYDLTGRKVTGYEAMLEQGTHHFIFYACSMQSYLLTVSSDKYLQKRLMIQIGKGSVSSSKIVYSGASFQAPKEQAMPTSDFPYEPGDELRFTGYVTGEYGNVAYSVINDIPETDMDYVFDITFPTYTLTLKPEPQEGGTLEGAGDYEEGRDVNITAIPNEGYGFINWIDYEDQVVSTEAEFVYTMPADDVTLTANFELVDYNLVLVANTEEGGEVYGSGTYHFGHEVTVSAIAYEECYKFAGWTDDDGETVSNDAEFTYTMPAKDVILTASFERIVADGWSCPVNISNMPETDRNPDIAIDNSGTMHCVWSKELSNRDGSIYYAYSTDHGDTWSQPECIQPVDTVYSARPRIVIDSEDNLYVTYEYGFYTASRIVMQQYRDDAWSKIDTVSLVYSYARKMTIDPYDKIYLFYYIGNYRINYRYYENEIWSDRIIPYDDVDNSFCSAKVDSEGNIHLIAWYDDKRTYLHYNYSLDQWQSPVTLSDNPKQYDSHDITVDSQNHPHAIWSEYISDYDYTFYSYFTGTEWAAPELIVENHPFSKNIAHHEGKIYISSSERDSDEERSVVIYQRDNQEQWYGKRVFTTHHGFSTAKLFTHNENLYFLFSLFDGEQRDVYLIRTTDGLPWDASRYRMERSIELK